MAEEARLGICVNPSNNALSQYQGYDFNGFAVLPDGRVLASSADGLFVLDDADKDDGAQIAAFIETAESDYGIPNQKRFRNLDASIETSGPLSIGVTVDGTLVHTYVVAPDKTGQKAHKTRLPMGRNWGQGTMWQFKVGNVDGCDFSLDELSGLAMILHAGR